MEGTACGAAGVPEVAAAGRGAGVPDPGGPDGVPSPGAVLSPQCPGRHAGGGAAADGRGLLREFRGSGLIEWQTRLGRVVQATRLTGRQAQILLHLGFLTPVRLLAQVLPPLPHIRDQT